MTPLVFGILRNQVRKVLPGLVRRGFSFRKIARTLREAGLGYRTANMLSDFREAEGIWLGEKWGRAAPYDEVFKKGWMIEEDLRFPAKYRINFELDTTNIWTGEYELKQVSMFSDQHLSPEGWSEEFMQDFAEGMCDPDTRIDAIHFKLVRHNITEPY